MELPSVSSQNRFCAPVLRYRLRQVHVSQQMSVTYERREQHVLYRIYKKLEVLMG